MTPEDYWAHLPSNPTVRDPNAEVHRRIAELLADGWRPDLGVIPPLWRMANGQTLAMYRRHEKAIRAGHGDERPDDQLTSLVDSPTESTCRWPTDGRPPEPGANLGSWNECGLPAVLDVTNGPAVYSLRRVAVCELHRHDAYRAGWHAVGEPELDSLDEVAPALPPLPNPAELVAAIHGMLADFAGYAGSWPERTVEVMRAAAVVLQGGAVPDGLGFDPQRGGPSALGRLLDDHVDAAEHLLRDRDAQAEPAPWWDVAGRLRLLGLRSVSWGAVRAGAWAERHLHPERYL